MCRLLRYEFSKKNVVFPIFQLNTIFLIFSDTGIVFSVKFYVDYTCLDSFLINYLVFCMIFKKKSCKKFAEKFQNFEISRKPPYSISRAETWKKFTFSQYVCKISTKSEHPTWRWLHIWRETTRLLIFIVKKVVFCYNNPYNCIDR